MKSVILVYNEDGDIISVVEPDSVDAPDYTDDVIRGRNPNLYTELHTLVSLEDFNDSPFTG